MIEEIIVNLITIYDKTDTATISDKELKDLIKAFRSKDIPQSILLPC